VMKIFKTFSLNGSTRKHDDRQAVSVVLILAKSVLVSNQS
jgi:hypothetical protein